MKQKLHLVLGKDDLRPIFKFMLLSREVVVATNSHILVVHDPNEIFEQHFIDTIPDGEWLVPAKAVQEMSKPKAFYYVKDGYLNIEIKGSKTAYKMIPNGGEEGTYPNYTVVIPESYGYEANIIQVNPALLNDLRQAIEPESPGVILEFSGLGRAMKVRVSDRFDIKNYKAVIMPMMLNE
jgi:hypothetical protein